VLAARDGELVIHGSQALKSNIQCAAHVLLRNYQSDIPHSGKYNQFAADSEQLSMHDAIFVMFISFA